MGNQVTRRHHYVPQFYLRHWCAEDGKLWVTARGKGSSFRALPSSFALENNLYDTSQHEELEGWDQEGDLSRLEGLFAGEWPDIFQRATNKRTKRNLSMWLAISYLRHPNHKQTVQRVNSVWHEVLARLRPGQEEVVIQSAAGEYTAKVQDIVKFTADTPENVSKEFLLQMRASAKAIGEIFFERKWSVFVSDTPVFITGDCPLVLWRGDSIKPRFGLGTPGTQITFPLSPYKLLMMDDALEKDGMSYPLLDIGTLNEGIIEASRFVFSAQALITPTPS